MTHPGQPARFDFAESRYSGAGIVLGCRDMGAWEVLLAKRGEEPFLGYWSVPGGGKHPSDPTPMATALREASEELFRGRDILKELSSWLREGFHPGIMPIQRHSTPRGNPWRTFFLELAGKPPIQAFDILPHEIAEVAWFRVSELPALLHPCVVSTLEHFQLVNGTGLHPA